jgi:hypothetical protein
LLAANLVVPTLCAAHCSPAKTATHHHATFAKEKTASMCDDCSSSAPQLHACSCPNTTQIDARIEPSFALTTQQTAANSVVLENSSARTHEFSGPKTFSQHQPTLPPQNFVTAAAPLRL